MRAVCFGVMEVFKNIYNLNFKCIKIENNNFFTKTRDDSSKKLHNFAYFYQI